jgi:hypothetical protein
MATGAVIARIVSQYSDKGSKAAAKDIARLGKQFDSFGKKAAKSFGLAATGAAALAVKVGKDSIKAIIEQQKSQSLLANTLKNSIGATDAQIAAIEDYIDKTELLTNVQDTDLRDSFTKLAVAFGNVSDATDVQGVALNVAAGTGKDLALVTDALTKASQGNFTALKKLVPTLDSNIVKNKDLGKALIYLNTTYKDAAQTAAKNDPWTRLLIVFENLEKRIGKALLPAFQQFAGYIETSIVPALESWIDANGYRLTDTLIVAVDNIKEVVKAFTNIYNVIKNINNILPFGISGWIQLGVALSVAAKVAGLYRAFLAALGVTLLATNVQLRLAAKAALEKGAADGAASLGGHALALSIAETAINLKTFIVDAYASRLASLQAAAGFTAAGTAATGFNLALLRLKATFLTALTFLKRYAKQLAIALAAFEAINWILDKITGKNKNTLSDSARAVEYSVWKAEKATTSMDEALNAYKETQAKVITKTKEQIAEEKRLAAIKAKQLAADKLRAKYDADYAKINAQIAKDHGVKLLTSEEEKLVQIYAADALLDRQKKIDAINKQKLADLKEEVLLRKVVNDLSARYDDILTALADNEISSKDVEILALKWNVTKEAVQAYLTTIFSVEDGKISDDEIIKLAQSWGSTQAQAAQYLDFYQALNDGILSDGEIEKLKSKWKLTEDQVRMYADFVGIVNDGKLTDAEIIKIKDKWKLTTDQVVDYILKIGSPVSYSGTLIDPARAAELAWKDATAALQAYLALLAKGTGAVVTGKTDTSSAAAKAAADAAAKAAADAAAKAAADAAAAAKAQADRDSHAAAMQYATAKAAGDQAAMAAAATGVHPSSLAAGESGAIGAASIAAQLRAAEEQFALNQHIATYAAFQAKERADAAAAQAAASTAQAISDAYDAEERARIRNMIAVNSASGTVATASSMSNGGNLMSGPAPVVNITVQGSVTAEEDLVQAVRNGLLATQYNGNQITLQAI